jgi:hypothetical protein
MVRAILDGSKTQTRRIVKGMALEWLSPAVGFTPEFVASRENSFSPYGQPGDWLWARETWGFNPDFLGIHAHACYRADPGHEHDGIKWKPSIHMPRAACRIRLEVTGVRVERLQDISEADARAEGCCARGWTPSYSNPDNAGFDTGATAVEDYAELWESINGAGSWDANPWVWVIEFKRVTP